MNVVELDHVNIRTKHVAETINFFVEVLGMKLQPVPGVEDINIACWLLDNEGRACVHVGGPAAEYPSDDNFPFEGRRGSASVHHVALRCANFEDVRKRMEERGLLYSENYVPEIKLNQIYVMEMNDVLLELNFYGE